MAHRAHMATVGHVAAGLAAARGFHGGRRPQLTEAVWWSAVALLPDADVIGLPLGIRYEAPWGHRGAAHSLVFALAVGVLVGFAARWFKRPVARTMFWTSIVIGSHGLLDTLTDGGLGCALLWPFDLTRYFAPWRPIPVAPIGLGMLSPYGAIVVLIECVFFAPLLFVALRSARDQRPAPAVIGAATAMWLLPIWLFASTDPVREKVVAFVLRDQTMFSDGYSEESFQSIVAGASDQEVRRLLGTPYGEGWFFQPPEQPVRARETAAASLRECRSIRLEKGVVLRALEDEACRGLGIQPGTPLADVRRILGAPSESCWVYSWSPRFAFRLRMVCFDRTIVSGVLSRWALTE
jgi:inner membrane protein